MGYQLIMQKEKSNFLFNLFSVDHLLEQQVQVNPPHM